MTFEHTIQALRAVDLPQGRRVELIRQASYATTDAERAGLVTQARIEAQEAAQRRTEASRADHAARAAWREELAANPAPEPVHAPKADRLVEGGDPMPEPRPVTDRWMAPTMRRVAHGSLEKYGSGCRCKLCTDEYRAEYRRRYYQANKQEKPANGHGSRYYYQRNKCRCEPCTKANAEYLREWEARKRAKKDVS